jgi:hypothetical protein
MSESTLFKLIAMVSGLLFLSLLAALGAVHGYRAAEAFAVVALGACVVCYGLQFNMQSDLRFGMYTVLLVLAAALAIVSWGLGAAAFAAFLMGR